MGEKMSHAVFFKASEEWEVPDFWCQKAAAAAYLVVTDWQPGHCNLLWLQEIQDTVYIQYMNPTPNSNHIRNPTSKRSLWELPEIQKIAQNLISFLKALMRFNKHYIL